LTWKIKASDRIHTIPITTNKWWTAQAQRFAAFRDTDSKMGLCNLRSYGGTFVMSRNFLKAYVVSMIGRPELEHLTFDRAAI
jgi:hypothetical protein